MAELLKHELYETAVWDLKPESQGRLAVAHGRGGPFHLAWEVHGRGPIHIVVSPDTPSLSRFDLAKACAMSHTI